MAVHAQYAAHAFHHDPSVVTRAALDTGTTASTALLGDCGCGGHQLAAVVRRQQQVPAVGGDTVFSDFTCNNNNGNRPRKRARVGDVAGAALFMDLESQRALLPPPVPVPQAFAPAGDAQSSSVLCSSAASTSGRTPAGAAPASLEQGLLSHLHRHGVEIDALVRIETERLRAGLQEARRRHARAVVSAARRAAARRLRAAEADLERAAARNAELDEELRRTAAEGQAWRDVARSHEAVAAGLRAALDNLLRPPPCAAEGGEGEGDAEDARSCCFENEQGRRARACRSCGAADACVLLLPCRHLCLCGGCEAAAEACPVCAATKNASLHVLLS